MNEWTPKGLSSSLHPSLLPQGYASHALNVRVDRGVIEARMGIGELWKRSGSKTTDLMYGAGFGRYEGTEEYIVVVKRDEVGLTRCNVYSLDENGTELGSGTYETTPWNYRYPSTWKFAQHGQYIYGVNANDGIFRKTIGNTAETAWRQVKPTLVNVVASESVNYATTSIPAPSYPQPNLWNSGAWAGSYSYVESGFWGAPSSAITNNELVFTIGSDSTRHPNGKLWHVFTFTTAIDLLKSRYWSIPISVDCEWDDTRQNEEPYLDILGAKHCRVLITEDSTAPASSLTDFDDSRWTEVRCYATPNDISPSNPNQYASLSLAVDFEETQAGAMNSTVLDAVKKIAVYVPISAGNNFTCTVGIPYQGGNMLSKPTAGHFMDGGSGRVVDPIAYYGESTFKDIEYAVTSYDTGTTNESEATKITFNRARTLGAPIFPSSLPLGAKVSVTFSAAAATYDRVRIYRKRHSDGGQWYLIYQSPSSSGGSYTDALVDAANDPLDWGVDLGAVTQVIRSADYDFGESTPDLYPSCCASWNGHFCLGVGREVYLSYQGDPTRFVAPLRDSVPGAVETDDVTMGRTLYMSYTLGDTVLDLFAPGELYAVGYEGVYAMVGDSALEASPFRKLPNTFGALGDRASAQFENGVLVAAAEGLFYYQIARFGTSVEETRTLSREMTDGVRDTYQFLIAKGAANDVVVSVHGQEIYVVRGRYFMKLNKERKWECGAWNSTALASGGTTPATTYGTVAALPALPTARDTAVARGEAKNLYGAFDFTMPTPSGSASTSGIQTMLYDSKLGGVAFSMTGVMFRLDKSSAGAPYVTDAGYAIPWVYAYGEWLRGAARISLPDMYMLVESASTASASGVVRLIAEEYDGIIGSRVYATDRASNESRHKVLAMNTHGGQGHMVTVVGQSAAHKVIQLSSTRKDKGAGDGN